ncbi:hypothetical protein Btru_001776 [Bulinus truncatus]|nr:hypothetical protein Btru_001776 [Bulinus truncatus]
MITFQRSSIREKPTIKDGGSKQIHLRLKIHLAVTPVSGPTTPVAPAPRGFHRAKKNLPPTPRITPPSSSPPPLRAHPQYLAPAVLQYRCKLEKKVEKEAEEERRRQEEARLAEEERLRKEEEEQRRLEEEAAEARREEGEVEESH